MIEIGLGKYKATEIVELPNGDLAKLNCGELYNIEAEDLEIELLKIRRYEIEVDKLWRRIKAGSGSRFEDVRTLEDELEEVQEKHAEAYRNCIRIISPVSGGHKNLAHGWNEWSDWTLKLFLNPRLHKVAWGSGNCGKSQIFGACLYIKWRVNPKERKVLIVSKVMADASDRVIGYIKSLHQQAPKSAIHNMQTAKGKDREGIDYLVPDTHSEGSRTRWLISDRAGIISVPLKKNATLGEIGANLMGKHPFDRLIIAFDEAQEIEGQLLSERIYLNWLTNERKDIYAWGNPQPVEYHMPESYDVLFKMIAKEVDLLGLKKLEKEKETTWLKEFKTTALLHYCMMDSPKDKEDTMIDIGAGLVQHRLSFLAGKNTIEEARENDVDENTPAWYSQVLGFPFIMENSDVNSMVLNNAIVEESRKYPLAWAYLGNRRSGGRINQIGQTQFSNANAGHVHETQNWSSDRYFMGVDCGVSGNNDDGSIVVGRMGLMLDGRWGVDLMNGKYSKTIKADGKGRLIDKTIQEMWEISESVGGIPLRNISVDVHGTGEVLRYALEEHIQKGYWKADWLSKQRFHVVNPTIAPTDRYLFRHTGQLRKASEICTDVNTEYWVAIRCAVITKQIFNIPEYILKQFYNRYLMANGNNTKYKLEPKDAMRKRKVKSPNDADALCIMFDLLRNRGFAYRFIQGGQYKEKYGEVYKGMIEDGERKRAMGVVSRMLGIRGNFGGGRRRVNSKWSAV